MALVSHPNLALIFGAESWYGRPILVCELLAGGTLADRHARGRLPVDQVIGLGIALADVLAAIHDAGVLHRDLKPSNIGFTEHGAPKLLDFGLARMLDSAFPRFATTSYTPSASFRSRLSPSISRMLKK